ncbi:MAG: B12-binding domain-containing radical SAM protein, partial [Acidobacteria bacterium]|nr:B12-binding domain-containing radical SAM protein [Acidobacteriota bacterium]
ESLDLSMRPMPDFSDFHLDRYPFMSANASVGCPFNCTFCTIPIQWGKYRQKSPKQVAAELINLYRKYSSQLFLLVDSLLNPLITDLAQEFITSGVCIYWDGSLRVSPAVCNSDNTLLWRRGGFYRAHLGIETGSQRILDAMDKRITLDQIKTALSTLAGAGIKTTTFWVVGYPGETEEDFIQSLKLAEELKDDIYETTIRPYLYYEMKQDYFQDGLVSHKNIPLYPAYAREKLLVESLIMDYKPSREETVQRLNRFDLHIRKLGIPNPYSLFELNQADRRWQELHQNAVPPVIRFKDTEHYIDECRTVEKIYHLKNNLAEDDGIFGF